MSTWANLAGFSLLAVAAYCAVIGSPRQDNSPAAKSETVAGWAELYGCSLMQSLDGTRELVLLQDHTVELREKAASGEQTGTWAFDEARKRYFITLGAQEKSYTLVQPEDSEVCILARGEMTSANMEESWYSRTLQDLYGDVSESER